MAFHSRAATILCRVLCKALGDLETPLRLVFASREIEGFSPQDTARVLGLSIGTAKTRLMPARLQQRKKLSAWFERRLTLATR